MSIHLHTFLLMLWAVGAAHGGPATAPVRHEADVIYGRKDGMALTLDVVRPEKANGLGAIFVYSGGWFSQHNFTPASIQPFTGELLNRGYTIFVVVHGSQPRYTIPDAIGDVKHAVRFVRANAKRWTVDEKRLGVFGGSAGGHLSLMIGLNSDDGDPKAADPIDRVSSRVAAVAAWFPPTDFLNYGEPNKNALKTVLEPFKAAFDFRELDPKSKRYVQIKDEKRVEEIEKQISPMTHVSKDDPPVLLIHGDKDVLVPMQQSEVLVEKLKEVEVPVKLVVRPGMGHGWGNIQADAVEMADWFDGHLRNGAGTRESREK
ncbi:MAG TPA: alpha/beta hydrolase [Tepidisphaeraceae bacterium]|jgi:acetyl esterase/lipase